MKVRDESLFSVSRKMRSRYSLCVVFALLFRFSSGIVPFSFLPFFSYCEWLYSLSGKFSFLGYVFLGLVGFPVFTSPSFGGLTYLLNPTFGFLPGFFICGGA